MSKVFQMRAKPEKYVIPRDMLSFKEIELQKVKMYSIGISEWVVSTDRVVMISRGLGSCMGIALYDADVGVAGFFHAMLPSIDEGVDKENLTKYVDSGIDFIIEQMKRKGARTFMIEAKMAGGANMFKSTRGTTVGERNIEMARKKLKEWGIRIKGEDVGGNRGRTVIFNTMNYKMLVKYVWGDEKLL